MPIGGMMGFRGDFKELNYELFAPKLLPKNFLKYFLWAVPTHPYTML